MANEDRFAPPSLPDLPSDIVAPPSRASASAPPAKPTSPSRSRERVRYRRPLNTPLIVWVFALLGVMAAVVLLAQRARQWVTGAPPLPVGGEGSAPPASYRPVAEAGAAILISMKVSPAGARVFVDGNLATSNPIRLPRSQQRHTILVSAPGYEPQSFERTADKPQAIHVQLQRSRPR